MNFSWSVQSCCCFDCVHVLLLGCFCASRMTPVEHTPHFDFFSFSSSITPYWAVCLQTSTTSSFRPPRPAPCPNRSDRNNSVSQVFLFFVPNSPLSPPGAVGAVQHDGDGGQLRQPVQPDLHPQLLSGPHDGSDRGPLQPARLAAAGLQ